MSTPTPPIRPPDRTEQERIQLSATEADKKIREKFEESKGQKKPGFFMVTWLLLLFRNIFNLFLFDRARELVSPDAQEVLDHLKKFRLSLEILAREEKSEEIAFIEALSIQWALIEKDLERLELHPDAEPHLLQAVRKLKISLDSYKASALHSFAYYLEQHAGESWFPFPFLEMIRALHNEAKISFETSNLKSWIAQISKIVN